MVKPTVYRLLSSVYHPQLSNTNNHERDAIRVPLFFCIDLRRLHISSLIRKRDRSS